MGFSHDAPLPDWADWRTQAFDPDGAFRDVFVDGTTIHDWDKVLGGLPSAYTVTYWDQYETPEFVEKPWPVSTTEIFNRRNSGLSGEFIQVNVGRTQYHAHFFMEESIEFDMDPRQVESWSDVVACFEFMAWLERLLDKPVFLSYEGSHETPIAQCVRGQIFRHKGWELNA